MFHMQKSNDKRKITRTNDGRCELRDFKFDLQTINSFLLLIFYNFSVYNQKIRSKNERKNTYFIQFDGMSDENNRNCGQVKANEERKVRQKKRNLI